MKKIDRETGKPFTLENTTELKEEVNAYWLRNCNHEQTAIRLVAIAGGSVQCRTVCLVCGGRVGNAIKKSEAPDNCEYEDVVIREQYQACRDAELEEIYQRHIRKQKDTGQGFKARYQAYLQSAEWGSRRSRVLKRASGVCEGCLERPATEVHHLHYAHVFDELLYELVALCDDCHSKAHRHLPISIDEHRELACNGCRWGSWDDAKGSWCERFNVPTGIALAPDGDCGPDIEGFEPLK